MNLSLAVAGLEAPRPATGPTLTSALRIAKALGVPVSRLVKRAEGG